MREQSVAGYIGFGTTLRYLQDAKKGWLIHHPNSVKDNLARFLRELDQLGLVVTTNLATAEGLVDLQTELEKTPEDEQLTQDQADRIVEGISTVRKTLFAEAKEKKAFVTAPKRWDVQKLLSDPGSLFGKEVFEALDDHAAYDFAEAARCIAFERSTAAAFHIMRGTEAVLRSFYCHIVKRNRLPKEKQMWGSMVNRLEARSSPPPAALLENLDSIRRNFRNPTQHPDAIYDIDRAQDLFGLVTPAVNQMVSLMDSK